ncbi:hypothetical protein PGB90_002774 [Kerria lacca]
MESVTRYSLTVLRYSGWFIAPIYSLLWLYLWKRLPPQKQPNILNLSATKLAKKIRNRELTSEQVVNAFVERCRDINGLLNAIVEDRFAEALNDAKNVDEFIDNGQKTKEQMEKETPLLGVPVTIKESCKLEGMSYCVGAKLRKGIRAEEDGKAVANLKKSGAIPIAVTNTPEFCASAETLNKVTGYTHNPYDRRRSAGGSSGGEASLIASAASVIGIGSDYICSIRVPCLFNGVFGHKPTPGIVPNEGHFPDMPNNEIYQKLLCLGPICRYAEDLKPMLKILAGEKADTLNLDTPVKHEDLKIYYLLDKGFSFAESSVNSDIKKSIKTAVDHFQKTYGCQVQKLELRGMNDLTSLCIVHLADVENLNKLFCLKRPEDESNAFVEYLKAVIKLSDYCLQTAVARLLVEMLSHISVRKRLKKAAKRNEMLQQLLEILGNNGVLILPSYTQTAFFKYELLFKITELMYSFFANVFGLPSTQIPAGLNKKGLPIGFQVVANPMQDRLCIAVAEELEKALGGWKPPPNS